jgi:hypothetical protein
MLFRPSGGISQTVEGCRLIFGQPDEERSSVAGHDVYAIKRYPMIAIDISASSASRDRSVQTELLPPAHRPISALMVLSRLTVVVFPELSRWWIARSLERDIAATGRTPEAALDSVLKIAQAHIMFDVRHGREPLSAFAPAPRPYWKAFLAADRSGQEAELRDPVRDRIIRVIAARLACHPALRVRPLDRSRDAVVAAFDRHAHLVLGPFHDRVDAVVGEHLRDAGGNRRAIAAAGV